MYLPSIVLTLLAGTAVQAISLAGITSNAQDLTTSVKRSVSGIFSRQSKCPAVWSDISKTLTQQFVANGECTDAARSIIRLAFHDCFAGGKCDGSIILANECGRAENNGLQRGCDAISNLAKQTGVGVADLIQFAGSHAILSCPGGPRVPAYIGRKDSSVPSPEGQLPSDQDSAKTLIASFASRGFSSTELVALVGAHTCARQRFVDPSQAGVALDKTVGRWDNKFYGQVLTGFNEFRLDSDRALSVHLKTVLDWTSFSVSQTAWANRFVPAMSKMSLLGTAGASSMIDCTSALPAGTRARDIRSGNIFERATIKNSNGTHAHWG